MKLLYQLTSPMEKSLGVAEMERRLAVLRTCAAADTEVSIRSIPRGPGSIESAYDAAIVVPELLNAVRDAERDDFSAMIVGCFSDPGLEAMREVVRMPVVGPGASAMHLAAQLGTRFSVISPGTGPDGRMTTQLRALGLAATVASVRGMGLSVMDLARQDNSALERVAEVGRRAREEDGADVLVLGCMSMAFLNGIIDELQERIGLPVVNPVMAALKTAEMVVAMHLGHSKVAYPVPPQKEML